MALYNAGDKAVLYKGDYRPAELYKGREKISGYASQLYTGESLSVNHTYNDDLRLKAECASDTQKTLTGKNLFDVGSVDDYTKCYPTVEYTISGNSISCKNMDYSMESIYKNTPIDPGTYAISFKSETNSSVYNPNNIFTVICYSNDGTILTDQQEIMSNYEYNNYYKGWIVTGNSITITVPQSVAYWNIGFVFRLQNGYVFNENDDIWIKYYDIQVEKGTTVTPYEPYCGGIPSPNPDYPQPIIGTDTDIVCSGQNGTTRPPVSAHITGHGIGDYRDSIDIVAGRVIKTQNTGMITADGEIIKFKASGSIGQYWNLGERYSCPNICYFNAGMTDKYRSSIGYSFSSNNNTELIFTKADMVPWCGSVDALNDYCKTHPIDIVYALATPIVTDITDTPQGQAWLALHTYPHYTSVVSTSADHKPTLTADIKTFA